MAYHVSISISSINDGINSSRHQSANIQRKYGQLSQRIHVSGHQSDLVISHHRSYQYHRRRIISRDSRGWRIKQLSWPIAENVFISASQPQRLAIPRS